MSRPGQSSTALLVIDMQRQFTEPDGTFPVAGVDKIVDDMIAFVDLARSHGSRVFWVQQSARAQVGLGRATMRYGRADAHQGSGIELDPRFQPTPEDIRLPKWRQSAFFMTDLDLCLRRLGIERVLICGITTNVCVTAAAKDASERDYETIVLGDLTASLPISRGASQIMSAEEVQTASLAFIQYSYGEVLDRSDVKWED